MKADASCVSFPNDMQKYNATPVVVRPGNAVAKPPGQCKKHVFGFAIFGKFPLKISLYFPNVTLGRLLSV